MAQTTTSTKRGGKKAAVKKPARKVARQAASAVKGTKPKSPPPKAVVKGPAKRASEAVPVKVDKKVQAGQAVPVKAQAKVQSEPKSVAKLAAPRPRCMLRKERNQAGDACRHAPGGRACRAGPCRPPSASWPARRSSPRPSGKLGVGKPALPAARRRPQEARAANGMASRPASGSSIRPTAWGASWRSRSRRSPASRSSCSSSPSTRTR